MRGTAAPLPEQLIDEGFDLDDALSNLTVATIWRGHRIVRKLVADAFGTTALTRDADAGGARSGREVAANPTALALSATGSALRTLRRFAEGALEPLGPLEPSMGCV